MIKRVIVVLLILVGLVALLYDGMCSRFSVCFPETPSISSQIISLIAFVIAGVFGAFQIFLPIWDKYGKDKELSNPSHLRLNKETDPEEAYFRARENVFAQRQKLFVMPEGSRNIPLNFSDGERHQTYPDIEQAWIDCKGRFVLIGDPGAGKSTVMEHLLKKSIDDYRQKREGSRFPLWIDLGLSDNPEKADELLSYWWTKQHQLPDSYTTYLRNNLCLFLDGLNEMPLDSREARAKALKQFIEGLPDDIPIVVSCRVRDYEDDQTLNLGLDVVRVEPLDGQRVETFIRLRWEFDPLKQWSVESLLDEIEKEDALKRMVRNPLNLEQLIEIYRVDLAPPPNLNVLYKRYIEILYKNYTKKREQSQKFPLLNLELMELEERMKQLAYLMLEKGSGSTGVKAEQAQKWSGKTALNDGIN
jgi:predicted NACHT family NTPase